MQNVCAPTSRLLAHTTHSTYFHLPYCTVWYGRRNKFALIAELARFFFLSLSLFSENVFIIIYARRRTMAMHLWGEKMWRKKNIYRYFFVFFFFCICHITHIQTEINAFRPLWSSSVDIVPKVGVTQTVGGVE